MEEQSGPRNPIPAWAWIIAIVVIIVGLQFYFTRRLSAPEEVPLSQVVTEITNGNVQSIEVNGEQMEVTLVNPPDTVVSSTKEPGVGLIETLSGMGLTQEQLNSFEFVPKDQSALNTIFSIALSFLPILLLLWIFTRRNPLRFFGQNEQRQESRFEDKGSEPIQTVARHVKHSPLLGF